MHKIHIDFETRSEINIFDVGVWAYSMHSSTEIMCLAFAVDDGPVYLIPANTFLTSDYQRQRKNFFPTKELIIFTRHAVDKDSLFYAHNAFFEQCIWRNILSKLFNIPCPPIKQWRCSAAKAAAMSLPRSLEGVSEALSLSIKKDLEGGRLMKKLSRQRIKTEKNPNNWNSTEEELIKLGNYCMTDVEVEREVDKVLPDLIPSEQQVWFLDQEINFRGVQLDVDLIKSAMLVFSEYSTHLIEEIKKITHGALDGVSRIKAITYWIEDRTGIKLDNLQKGTVDTLLKDETLPEDVKLVLEARRNLGKTSVKKFYTMNESMDEDGRLRDLFMYHGASTGRWSGKLVQMQNLPRGSIKDVESCVTIIKNKNWEDLDFLYQDIGEAVSSCIRGAIVSKFEHDLICADYSAIEARVLLWCAKDEVGLRKYREGIDLYIDMAQKIYQKNLTKENKKERNLGKTAILGLGYGCGKNKFYQMCIAQGLNIEETLAHKTVDIYRRAYPTVTNFWANQELAAKQAISTGNIISCYPVKWGVKNNFLICRLPSGRSLRYYKPSIEGDKITFWATNSVTRQFEKTHVWGGVLTENIVSGISRDLLASAMLKCEEKGYRVAMTVHDEIVSEIPEDFGSLEEFVEIMTDLPEWAKGLPINAEGWRGKRYKK